MATGKIITIDGGDRAGKHTQAALLCENLKMNGQKSALLEFPQYNSLSGELVKEYLAGHYGSKEQLGAKLPSLIYAFNRFEEKEKLLDLLGKGYIVVLDRYIESNMAYQSAKLIPEERAAFQQWLKNLEFGIFKLPNSDLVIYLHVPVEIAKRLGEKEARETGKQKDIHETDEKFQKKVVEQYLALAAEKKWTVIECIEKGMLLSPEKISEMILDSVLPHLAK